MGLSIRAYARYRDVSEGAVRKAIRSDRITIGEDGLIDSRLADQQWEANTDPAKSGRGGRRKSQSSKMKKVPLAALDAVENTLKENGIEASAESDYQRARTANEILKAQIANIELRIMKGELVDRNKACDLIFNAARSERDAWLNWPARVTPAMAAQLGVDEHLFYIKLYEHVRVFLFRLANRPPA